MIKEFASFKIAISGLILGFASCSREPVPASHPSAAAGGEEKASADHETASQLPPVPSPSIAEQVFGSKIYPDALKNQLPINASAIQSLLGKTDSFSQGNEFPGKATDSIALPNGDKFDLFPGPFSSSVISVGIMEEGNRSCRQCDHEG